MIIYNVTTKCERSIAEAWLKWLKEEHIPELVQTGCFTHAVILHLKEIDDEDGPTYAVQYHAESKHMYDHYIKEHAGIMREKAISKWGNKIISFRTLMEVVN